MFDPANAEQLSADLSKVTSTAQRVARPGEGVQPHRPTGRPIRRHAVYLTLALLAWCSHELVRADGPSPVIPVNGEAFLAQLVDIGPDWEFRFQTGRGNRQLAKDELVHWSVPTSRVRGETVWLADGSELVAAVTRIDGQSIHVEGGQWRNVTLPLELVRGVIVGWPADPLQADRLVQRMRESNTSQDVVLVDNGDQLSGILVGPDNQPALDLDRQPALYLRLDGRTDPVAIQWERVQAIFFNAALWRKPPAPSLPVQLAFRDGSLLQVQRIRADSGALHAELAGGIVVQTVTDPLAEPDPWETIEAIQPWSDRITYLSDLEPISYKHIPLLSLAWNHQSDANVLGGRLRAAGRLYSKGLGMPGGSRLAYDLNVQYQRFEAELAIDDAARGQGSVQFRVYVQRADGNWTAVAESPTVRGAQAPQPLQADISGALRIALIVDFADHGDVADYANWLNARLIR